MLNWFYDTIFVYVPNPKKYSARPFIILCIYVPLARVHCSLHCKSNHYILFGNADLYLIISTKSVNVINLFPSSIFVILNNYLREEVNEPINFHHFSDLVWKIPIREAKVIRRDLVMIIECLSYADFQLNKEMVILYQIQLMVFDLNCDCVGSRMKSWRQIYHEEITTG